MSKWKGKVGIFIDKERQLDGIDAFYCTESGLENSIREKFAKTDKKFLTITRLNYVTRFHLKNVFGENYKYEVFTAPDKESFEKLLEMVKESR